MQVYISKCDMYGNVEPVGWTVWSSPALPAVGDYLDLDTKMESPTDSDTHESNGFNFSVPVSNSKHISGRVDSRRWVSQFIIELVLK